MRKIYAGQLARAGTQDRFYAAFAGAEDKGVFVAMSPNTPPHIGTFRAVEKLRERDNCAQ